MARNVLVITYQMPKGVEHQRAPRIREVTEKVITYQMPKGVEHVHGGMDVNLAAGDYIPDAERR